MQDWASRGHDLVWEGWAIGTSWPRECSIWAFSSCQDLYPCHWCSYYLPICENESHASNQRKPVECGKSIVRKDKNGEKKRWKNNTKLREDTAPHVTLMNMWTFYTVRPTWSVKKLLTSLAKCSHSLVIPTGTAERKIHKHKITSLTITQEVMLSQSQRWVTGGAETLPTAWLVIKRLEIISTGFT